MHDKYIEVLGCIPAGDDEKKKDIYTVKMRVIIKESELPYLFRKNYDWMTIPMVRINKNIRYHDDD